MICIRVYSWAVVRANVWRAQPRALARETRTRPDGPAEKRGGAAIPTDLPTWSLTALTELSALRNDDGGWGYATGSDSNIEATALCTLALWARGADASVTSPGLAFLEQRRLAEGPFALSAVATDPAWATPLGAMALARSGGTSVAATVDWLLTAPVFTLQPTPATYGYDTGLRGWPWSAGDYSFVEPTSAAMLFLKQQGHSQHPRVREAVTLLLDRALPGGGWNYGEPVVLGHALFPAVVPTALALVALADEPSEVTAAALSWLVGQRGTITSLFSLGWAAVALNRWGALDQAWIDEATARWSDCPPARRTAMDTALCLLGLSPAEDHPLAL